MQPAPGVTLGRVPGAPSLLVAAAGREGLPAACATAIWRALSTLSADDEDGALLSKNKCYSCA